MFVITLAWGCMTGGVWLCYWRTELYSLLFFSCGFIGSCDSAYVEFDDDVLEEHYNALGFNHSFWGWFWGISIAAQTWLLLIFYILLEPQRLDPCVYIYVYLFFWALGQIVFQTIFCFALLHLVCNSLLVMDYKWNEAKSLSSNVLIVCSKFLNKMPS